ncbi:MAG: twin-arginine translocation signal domain-containing protein, partial [Bacteroidota bacterium]
MNQYDFTRRDFLKKAGLLTSASVLPFNLLGNSCSSDDLLSQLGLQLYTVRDTLVEKPQETLEAIRNAG